MLETDRNEILQELAKGRDALRDAAAGIDETLAARQPGEGRWSILECVEHVAVSEQLLLSKLIAARRCEGPPGDGAREKVIAVRLLNRRRRIESPEQGRPYGRYQTLEEAFAAFESVRAETLRFVDGFSDDPRAWITDHPLIPGPVTCREILLIVAAHPLRHAQQITEVRSALAEG